MSHRRSLGDIYVFNVETMGLTRLTTGQNVVQISRRWSPNGLNMVYSAVHVGIFQLFIVDSDGAVAKKLSDEIADGWQPAWSPNILFDGATK